MADLFIRNISLLATPLCANREEIIRRVKKIPRAAILIHDDRIAEVGDEASLSQVIPRNTPTYDAHGMLALPGLVDCHTHPVFVGNRAQEFHQRNAGKSYLEIAAAGGGIQASARQVNAASIEQIVKESLPRFNRSLACGVTTIESKSGYGLEWQGEEKLLLALSEIEKRIPQRLHKTFLIHVLPETRKQDREAFCREAVTEIIPQVASRNLASAIDVFCENGAFTYDEARAFLTAGKDSALQVTVHANQFGHSGGAELAAELQARSADHLEFLDEREIGLLAQAGVVGVILPASVFFLGASPYPPARTMIEHGMRVAIATDMNPGSSMTESLPFCLTCAAVHCRMSPEELLWAVTLDAARALRDDSNIGSLEQGKLADISFWNLPDIESLSYHFGNLRAAAVTVGGRIVYEDCDASRRY